MSVACIIARASGGEGAIRRFRAQTVRLQIPCGMVIALKAGCVFLRGLRGATAGDDSSHHPNSTILPQEGFALPSGTAHKTGNAGSSPASPCRSVR